MADLEACLTVCSMPVTLTFITAVSSGLAEHLPSTAASVRETVELLETSGHHARWVVCVDGDSDDCTPAALPGLEDADDVVFLHKQFGVSVARNVAMSHALDGWVLPLDGDDVLYPKGVLALADTIALMDESIMWVACNRENLDGSASHYWIDSNRLFAKGELNAEWHPHVFHPNSVAYRTEALFALNGWPATPGGEDLALTLRVTLAYPGATITPVVLGYRRWSGQTTAVGYELLRPLRHRLYDRFGLLAGRSVSTFQR